MLKWKPDRSEVTAIECLDSRIRQWFNQILTRSSAETAATIWEIFRETLDTAQCLKMSETMPRDITLVFSGAERLLHQMLTEIHKHFRTGTERPDITLRET